MIKKEMKVLMIILTIILLIPLFLINREYYRENSPVDLDIRNIDILSFSPNGQNAIISVVYYNDEYYNEEIIVLSNKIFLRTNYAINRIENIIWHDNNSFSILNK